VATITALRETRAGVAVALDGAPWRTLPVDAVVDARLGVGLELDRDRARALARALRRHRAAQVALRALTRREHSRASLDARLARVGVPDADRRAVVERAESAGFVDDGRFAKRRARQLAERGAGDRLVLDDLARQGIQEEVAWAATAALEPEAARAARIVETRGASARTVRYLASRGFSEEALEPLIAEVESRALG
jgi:regulatory protein